MRSVRGIYLLAISLVSFLNLKAQVEDSAFVMYQKDSAIIPETDPTTLFFQEGEKTTIPDKILIVTKSRKTLPLTKLLKGIYTATGQWVGAQTDSMDSYIEYTFADLDNDGKKELLIYNYTGGAHCCDEIYIFKSIAANKYQHVVKMFGGHTVITSKKEFEFSFAESFGYFFTCFACGFTDTTDGAPIYVDNITLKYNKGKVTVLPGDAELKSVINDNLGKLCEQPYVKLDSEIPMDEGLRKEVAMNLVVYYYCFGRNLAATQQLFNKYYKYPDAKKIWTAFTKNLLYIKQDNDF